MKTLTKLIALFALSLSPVLAHAQNETQPGCDQLHARAAKLRVQLAEYRAAQKKLNEALISDIQPVFVGSLAAYAGSIMISMGLKEGFGFSKIFFTGMGVAVEGVALGLFGYAAKDYVTSANVVHKIGEKLERDAIRLRMDIRACKRQAAN